MGMCKNISSCILCPWKNDKNALALSILLVSKIVRKQAPIKIKTNPDLSNPVVDNLNQWFTQYSCLK